MFESFQVVTLLTLLTRLLVGAYPQWQGCAPSRTQRIYFANHAKLKLLGAKGYDLVVPSG